MDLGPVTTTVATSPIAADHGMAPGSNANFATTVTFTRNQDGWTNSSRFQLIKRISTSVEVPTVYQISRLFMNTPRAEFGK